MAEAAARAYSAIRDMIAVGTLRAGQPLRESALAAAIGTSRTPVREALRRLAAEGIVEVQPNRGAQLVAVSEQDLAHIFDLRALLEPYAARLAVPNLTAADLDELDRLACAIAAAATCGESGLDDVSRYNKEFHGLLLRRCGNPLLVEALAIVVRDPLVQRTFHRYSAEQIRRSINHHKEIAAAVRAGDPDWAESVMRAHLRAARAVFF